MSYIEAVNTVHTGVVHVLPMIPNPGPAAVPGMEGKVSTVMSWMKWGGAMTAVISILGIGSMMGISALSARHGGGAEHFGKLGWVAVAMFLLGSASGIVGALGS